MIKSGASFVYDETQDFPYEIPETAKAYVEIISCAYCHKPFLRRTKLKHVRKVKIPIRKGGCVTCSKLCSREYTRLRKGLKIGANKEDYGI